MFYIILLRIVQLLTRGEKKFKNIMIKVLVTWYTVLVYWIFFPYTFIPLYPYTNAQDNLHTYTYSQTHTLLGAGHSHQIEKQPALK
jgi:hypothetical protein